MALWFPCPYFTPKKVSFIAQRSVRRPRMSQEPKATLEACLHELHLSVMRREGASAAQQAQQESWSYLDFLRELAEREVQQRRQNCIARQLKASRLPFEKNWQS